MRVFNISISLLLFSVSPCLRVQRSFGAALRAEEPPAIVAGLDPGTIETFAALELKRHLQGIWGMGPGILSPGDPGASGRDVFAVGFKSTHPLIARLGAAGADLDPGRLGDEGYLLKTCQEAGRKVLVVTANTERGLLFGVYGLLDEHYGMGFFLHGDVFPVEAAPPGLVQVDSRRRPAQSIRGVLPWTDFLQSPSTWSFRDYALAIDQLAKMRMNLLQIHNYMGAGPGADINEPFLWFEIDGRRPFVFFDTAAWAKNPHNRVRRWGQFGRSPDRFQFGGADFFGDHDFGSEAALHTNFLENRAVYRKAAALFQQVLDHAHRRGLKVVLGTDIDVLPALFTEPPALSWDDPRVIAARLDQVLADYPDLDYLQLFFGEGSGGDAARYIRAVKLAHDHLLSKGSRIRLVTGGWGHAMKALAEAVRELPRDVILSCLADYGASAIDPLYGEAGGRETWATPWAECDNWNQTGLWYFQEHVQEIPESFAGMQRYGLTGETVLYWRDRDQDAYHLGQAQSQWDWDPGLVPPGERPKGAERLKTGDDIYRLWAEKLFGRTLAPGLAAIRAKGPAGGMGGADSGGMDGFRGTVFPGIEEAERQLASVHEILAQAGDPEVRERLANLSGRIAFSLHMKRANLANRRQWPWEKLPGPLREAVESFAARITTITELGTFASIQKKGIGLHFGRVEGRWRDGFPLKPPSQVTAKWRASGARISWRNEARPEAIGFHVYRSESPEGPFECVTSRPIEAKEYLDPIAGGERYYRVAAVAADGRVSPFSFPARVRIGAADDLPPRVVVISPPGTAPIGQDLRIEAVVADERDYPETSALLEYRAASAPPGAPWSKVPMVRTLRASFRGAIPSSSIVPEGVSWFVEGTDGRLSATFPPKGPARPFLTLAEEVHGPGKPPGAPSNLRIHREEDSGCGALRWDPVPGTHRYLIYRGERSLFSPDWPNYLTYVAAETTEFIDDDPGAGVFFYRVTAADRAGRESPPSSSACAARVAIEAEDYTIADVCHIEEDGYSGGATVELPVAGAWIGGRAGFPASTAYAVHLTLREEGKAALRLSIDGKEVLRTVELGIGIHFLGIVPVDLGEREWRLDVIDGRCFADRLDFLSVPPEKGRVPAVWPVSVRLGELKGAKAAEARIAFFDLNGGRPEAEARTGEPWLEARSEREGAALTIRASGLAPGKDYGGALEVLFGEEFRARVPVSFSIARDPALPDLWPPHQRRKIEEPIPAGGSRPTRIRIRNRGGSPLDFSISAVSPGARPRPASGRLERDEAREIEVVIAGAAVEEGAAGSARLEIRAGDQTAAADIDYSMARAPRAEEDLAEVHDDIALSHTQAWGELHLNRSVMDLPLRIAGKGYGSGIGTHAASETVYDLSGGFRRFHALVGVDDGSSPGGGGKIVLRISLDRGKGWELAYESPVKALGDPPSEIDLDLAGARRMKIEGDPAGDYHWDHIDLVEARLLR